MHVIAGITSLFAGFGAILLRNNIRRHKPFGKVYFWSMTVIFFSAVYLSVLHKNIFLFCISFFSYHMCLSAFRSLKLKKLLHGQRPLAFDWVAEFFFVAVHVCYLVLAFLFFYKNNPSAGAISLVFGFIGLNNNYRNIKRFTGKITNKNYWLLAHIGNMLGSYIAAITAFLVNNNKFFNAPPVVLWLAPTFLLSPLIAYEIRKYKRE